MKMMIEIQSPGERYRLGEVVHAKKEVGEKTSTSGGEAVEDVGKLSALGIAEMVDMEVASEMKELGLHVLICSVAWETLDGRRTFQRFLKFNVGQPFYR